MPTSYMNSVLGHDYTLQGYTGPGIMNCVYEVQNTNQASNKTYYLGPIRFYGINCICTLVCIIYCEIVKFE